MPLSFVVGVSDNKILDTNFLTSPCLAGAGSPHQVILVRDGLNVIAKLRHGLEQAENEWVVCVHQDVWLPAGWDIALAQQIHEAELRFGPIGVAGVYGVGDVIPADEPGQPLGAERIGWVVDRGRMLRDGPELPARVATLDELLLVVRRAAHDDHWRGFRTGPFPGVGLRWDRDCRLRSHSFGRAVTWRGHWITKSGGSGRSGSSVFGSAV